MNDLHVDEKNVVRRRGREQFLKGINLGQFVCEPVARRCHRSIKVACLIGAGSQVFPEAFLCVKPELPGRIGGIVWILVACVL